MCVHDGIFVWSLVFKMIGSVVFLVLSYWPH